MVVVNELYVWVGEGPDEDIGIIAFHSEGHWYPLVSSRRELADAMAPVAQDAADAKGISILLKRFSVGEVIRTLQPQGRTADEVSGEDNRSSGRHDADPV